MFPRPGRGDTNIKAFANVISEKLCAVSEPVFQFSATPARAPGFPQVARLHRTCLCSRACEGAGGPVILGLLCGPLGGLATLPIRLPHRALNRWQMISAVDWRAGIFAATPTETGLFPK